MGTMLLATATQLTVTATTERDPLMPRPKLNQRLCTMAATAMDGLHMATATTERDRLRPRLSPTTSMVPTLPTVTATTERGLPRLRLSPTTMATPPTVDMATTERGLLMPR